MGAQASASPSRSRGPEARRRGGPVPGARTRCATLPPPGVARTRAPTGPPRCAAPAPSPTRRIARPVFDALSDRLRQTLASLTGRGRISETDVDVAMREIRLSLLEADVNFRVVKDFVARVREQAVGAEILASLTAGQQVVKIVHDELVALLTVGDRTFHLQGNPAVISLVGLQGSGKTTSAAKLARYIVKQGRRPLLVAADPYRPAAADQLQTLGKALDIPVHRAPVGTAVVDIARGGVEAARRLVRDTVILDTAGRLTLDEALMAEIGAVNDAVKPIETLLIVDAMTGQEAVAVAQAFAAAFLGTGEKTDALEVFHPDRLAGRILGMGDILTLVERAQEFVDVKQAEKLEAKLRKAEFTLEDMLEQLQQVQKMGPIGQLMGMIPGMGGIAKEAQAAVDRGEMQRTEAIIRSMTPRERRDPNVLNASRRRRIAAGSGTTLPDVNRLVKQFGDMQRVMKQLGGMRGKGGGKARAMTGLLGRR
ncbi:MAG: signal recognition particle protein Srp54 [Chloroflexi bacterium]|nr:signal recognition particle protein Srp54 [Chloroflexota bacterium]